MKGFALGLTRDGRLLVATYAVRLFAYGFISVVLGLYLAGLGLEKWAIGLVFTAALADAGFYVLFRGVTPPEERS